MIEESRDPKLKMAYFDTLMDIYDRRIEYFGEEGYVSGRKGIDIIRYNEKAYDKAYLSFLRSVELTDKETDLNVIAGFIQTGSFMFRFNKIDTEAFLNNFMTSYKILNQKLSDGEDKNKITKVKEMINKVLTTSSIKDCGVIEGTFNEEFGNNGTDPDMLKTAEQLLSSSGCDNTAFYAEINEKLMEVSPDPGLAYEVAKFNIKNENFQKAADYLGKAIQHESDSGQKAIYQYQLAVILSSRLENFTEAKNMALQAAINKKGYGEPYLLLASNYITGFNECNPETFEKAAIYWLAVDYCIKAKQADPSLETKANDLIAQYKQYFPSVEDTFFRSLKAGDSYSFGCWINEPTTVKEK
jgi:tetratricopeptide (TPR) repeat protein